MSSPRPTAHAPAEESTSHTDDEITDTLYRHLRAGRGDKASGLIQLLFLAGRSVAQIVDGSFRLAVARMGEDRTGHEAGVFSWEHRAIEICIRLLHELSVGGASPGGPSMVAVGCAPSRDPYLLPTMAVARVLDSIGFDATNLGPETPSETLVRSIHELQPSLVWLSVTAKTAAGELQLEVEAALEAAESVGATLIVGGREAGGLKPTDHARFVLGDSMVGLASFAGALARRKSDGGLERGPS